MSAEPTKTASASKPAAAKKPSPKPRPAEQQREAAHPRAACRPGETPKPQPAEQQQEEPARRGFAFRGVFLAMPSWLASLIFHVLLFLILALVTVATPDVREQLFHVAVVSREDVDEIEDFEFQEQEIELTEATLESADFDAGMAEFGDIAAPETTLASDTSAHEDVEVDQIGMLFGLDGVGMAEVGHGTGSTTFFGVTTEGDYFMYVVDNSASMRNGEFENAVYELLYSVEQLPEGSFFYVIFFSDTAYPLFYPQTVPRWVRATQANKYKLRHWLAALPLCFQTRGEEAMAHALKLRPDVLYLLGDGAFTDKAVPKTLELQGKVDVVINTLGFNMKPQDAESFDKIARAFGGGFTNITVSPQFKKLAQQTKRPEVREPHSVWGIGLKGKKK